MTDPALIAKKLARVESCVEELRRHAQPALLRTDIREQRFVEHTLQIAVQSVLDVAFHIVADDRLGEPSTNRAVFDLLQHGGWLNDALAASLRDMAGFRNVLVHGYDDVDLDVVADIVEHRLEDLIAFVEAVRLRTRE